jgi:hypothetical protein
LAPHACRAPTFERDEGWDIFIPTWYFYGGMDEPEMKLINVFMCKLRKKLSNAVGGEQHIGSVWGRS